MSTTEIERRPLAPLDVAATRAAITQYQSGLKALLDPAEDLQLFKDRKGEKHSFVKRSGWRKIALWCDLSLESRTEEIDRAEDGKVLRARVVYRALAPSGRFADGEGSCDRQERAFSKPEHDILATAATRAANRAVSNLVGLGAVSAEEVDGGPPDVTPDTTHPFGPEASPELVAKVRGAIGPLIPGCPGDAAVRVFTNNFGYFPEVAGRTIMGMLWLQSNPPPSAPAQPPPQAPVRSPEGTQAPSPATAPTEQGPTAQGLTSGPEFDDVVTAAEVVEDLDEVDIDGLLDDPRK